MRLRRPHSEVYLHLVWATWDRLPLLSEGLRCEVYACIQAECIQLKTEVIAIGGVEDHVHLLVRLPTTVAIASLAQQIKGVSSHLVTHRLQSSDGFKWQGAYSAFSVSKSDVPRVRNYILRQEEHHRDRTYDSALELPDDLDLTAEVD